nr:MAG TPA: hypothetical protein [Caudoviricetes sp.]
MRMRPASGIYFFWASFRPCDWQHPLFSRRGLPAARPAPQRTPSSPRARASRARAWPPAPAAISDFFQFSQNFFQKPLGRLANL